MYFNFELDKSYFSGTKTQISTILSQSLIDYIVMGKIRLQIECRVLLMF